MTTTRSFARRLSLVVCAALAVGACGASENSSAAGSADTDPELFCDTLETFSIVAGTAFLEIERGGTHFELVVRAGEKLLEQSIDAAATPELAAVPEALVTDYDYLVESYGAVDFDLQRFVELDSDEISGAAGRVGLAIGSDIDPLLVEEYGLVAEDLRTHRNDFGFIAGYAKSDANQVWTTAASILPIDLSEPVPD